MSAALAVDDVQQDAEDAARVDAMLTLAPPLQPLQSISIDLRRPPTALQTPHQLRNDLKAFMAAAPPARSTRRSSAKVKQLNTRPATQLGHTRPRLPSPLGRLPVEILLEVFAHASIASLVSLADTCSFFRDLLMNGRSKRIWHRARQRAKPTPVPEPPPGWTEHDFARRVFGWAPCEVCGVQTDRVPVSFEPHAKICYSSSCRIAPCEVAHSRILIVNAAWFSTPVVAAIGSST
ncbi:hypothetical protein EXIGLDRAFT_768790 [Exidia glandulosa HHB12029]|uniref:F-box domain-containing protein n=1 Tax=Exidia glandulosa HHB12029 TaxID=1314781 RepID=A0A166AK28_EXIGL|nr:hypothetical protein EXIGLDRAFT_768790 [Exidia glandulosa HHB12029]